MKVEHDEQLLPCWTPLFGELDRGKAAGYQLRANVWLMQ